MVRKLEVVIPAGVDFNELGVRIEDDGSLGYDIQTLGKVATASGLDEDFFERQAPDIILNIIMGWYLAYRQLGGHPCPVMEEIHEGDELQSRFGAAYAGMPQRIQ